MHHFNRCGYTDFTGQCATLVCINSSEPSFNISKPYLGIKEPMRDSGPMLTKLWQVIVIILFTLDQQVLLREQKIPCYVRQVLKPVLKKTSFHTEVAK